MNASLTVGATASPCCRNSTPARRWRRCSATASPTSTACRRCTGRCSTTPSRESYDTSTLRICITGGASMPVEVLRGFEEAFGAIVLEGYGLSETSPVACSNHPGRERKPGSIGTPLRRGRDEGRRRGRQRGRPGRGRRDRDPRPQHHEGLLAAPRRDRGGDARRLVPHRRHGPDRRGRLLLHRRPQEGPDHPRRLQRLPARGRGGALRAPEDPRSRRRRRPPRRVGRGDRRRGRPPRGRGAGARGGQRLRQGADRRLQVPAPGLVPRRPARRARPARSSSARSSRRRLCDRRHLGELASWPGSR